MIRAKTSDTEVLESTLGADRLKMEVDMDGLVHICDMLIGQYSDEELAVLREYSTNARDSHRMAGQTRPIEVTLPCGSYDLPTPEKGRFLRIQDWGVGLSVEEIETVYSRIGKSTKDASNDFNGMMGIGGKSGLCATFGSFKIIAIKDGKKATVMVGRNEATEPVMDLASVVDTDEPNGVTIELPAPKYNNLRRKADNLFQFWPEGSVLVDGREPDKLDPKIKLSDDLWIVKDVSLRGGNSIIVMGDVPYPVDLDTKLADEHTLVAFVPIGAVEIAPSREALRLTPGTKEQLTRILADYDQRIKTAVQDSVNTAKNMREAMELALKWRSSFAKNIDLEITYKGKKVPAFFDVKHSDGKGGIAVTQRESHKLSYISRQERIFAGTLVDAVLVHGYRPDFKFQADHKKKLNAWAKENDLVPKHYVLTQERLGHGWFDPKHRVDWETIRKIKLHRNGVVAGSRPRGSYDMYIRGSYSYGKPADQIDTTEAIFWMEKDYFTAKGRSSYNTRRQQSLLNRRQTAIFQRYPNATFVELTSNRIDKFCRDFPQARYVTSVLDEIYDEFKQRIKQPVMMRLALEENWEIRDVRATLAKLDPTRIDDPKVRAGIQLAKKPHDIRFKKRLNEVLELTGKSGSDIKIKWMNPLEKYPLADERYLDHTYIYMNAVYAQEKK